ncbi:MAG: integration host factor subunit alpha [Alphaproteobacteria bacterium]|nr:integration host factor subunit alpha [Alphaproteobacteria bacterium]MDE2041666.1 integration host factor subunit alpha [Alphaproteobacteria bacterium]MDE2340469.1 integration host factor subunit alpha [Alphaproteobacteria bacterium]
MREKSVTRSELADAIQRNVGLTRLESAEFVEKIINHMTTTLASGENILITGFGSFQIVERNARTGRNPRTKVETHVAARRSIKFKPSQVLRDDMARGNSNGRKGLGSVFID